MQILLILAGLSSALALTQNAVLREILVEVQYNRIYRDNKDFFSQGAVKFSVN